MDGAAYMRSLYANTSEADSPGIRPARSSEQVGILPPSTLYTEIREFSRER
jgi:hypothetical protein